MPEFKVGDRVRTCEGNIAGRVVGYFTSINSDDRGRPWPKVCVTHAPQWPWMVGSVCWRSPDDLEHLD